MQGPWRGPHSQTWTFKAYSSQQDFVPYEENAKVLERLQCCLCRRAEDVGAGGEVPPVDPACLEDATTEDLQWGPSKVHEVVNAEHKLSSQKHTA